MISDTGGGGKFPVKKMTYYSKGDLFFLANGLPSDYEEELYPGCSVSYDHKTRRVADVAFDSASEQLLPVLMGGDAPQLSDNGGKFPKPDITYISEDDVLWLRNGFSTDNEMELFPGCAVFFDGQTGNVSGIRIDSAKALLLPVLLGDEARQPGEG
jgi:hypothetical protein